MADHSFRKIDIDALDEDQVLPTDLYDPFHLDPQSAASTAKEVERQVRSLAAKGDAAGALSLALQDAPYGDDSYAQAKNTTLQAVLFVLLQVNQSDMANIIKALSPPDRDTLLKFVYRGMENPVEGPSGNSQCAALLQWHARIIEATGVGSIVRTMADRRQV